MLIDKRVWGRLRQKDFGAENRGLQGVFCLQDLHWAHGDPVRETSVAPDLHQPYRYRECFDDASASTALRDQHRQHTQKAAGTAAPSHGAESSMHEISHSNRPL